MSSSALRERILAVERTARLQTGPLLPLLPATTARRALPALPPRQDSASPFGTRHPEWRLDSYIVPAAFPRSVKSSGRSQAAAAGREDADAALLALYERQAAASQEHTSVHNQVELKNQQQFHLAVNRYSPTNRRSSRGGGLTLLLSHANGFHKETWEPTMIELLGELNASTDPLIDEIWSIDAYNQGDSGLLNDEVLGDTHSWTDNGRDILNFILSYLPSPSLPSPPSKLPTRSASPTLLALDTLAQPSGDLSPSSRVFSGRRIVGIGHSAGGTSLTFACSAVPSLFSSVILCDPVLPSGEVSWAQLAGGAAARREGWNSREEARGMFLKKTFFKQWDPKVLDLYLAHGLRDVEGGGVALKTRPRNEALPFADPAAVDGRRAQARLSQIPPELPLHFIHAETGRSIMSEEQIEALHKLAPHSTRTRLPGAGHLLVQEDPVGTAKDIAECLRRDYTAVDGQVQ